MKKRLLVFLIFILFLLNFISAVPPLPENATFKNIYITNNLTVSNNIGVGNNLEVGQNVSALNGFFDFLGSSILRITNGWFNELNVVDLIVDTDTLFVDSTNDRVGIGTATPTEVLDINGNISLKDNNRIYFNTAKTKFLYHDSAFDAPVFVSPSNDGTLGLFSPEYPSLYFQDKNAGINRVEMVLDLDDAWSFGDSYFLFIHAGTAHGTLFTDNANNYPILLIDATNNRVGIGTTTPQNTLNVIGDINSTGGFMVGANIGVTANYSVGNCWFGINGGIVTSTNCTVL